MYIYELKDWPRFYWSEERLSEPLASVQHRQGRLIGRMEGLGFDLRQEAVLKTLTADVLKTSEIEGTKFDAEQVRSSIARHLGMDLGALKAKDRDVEGIVEMTFDATRRYDAPLTVDRLFSWHSALFPAGRSGLRKIRTGVWRDDRTGPMQVVSGPIGRERVHFEAPDAGKLDRDIAAFLHWFNKPSEKNKVLKAGLAHLWFVTLHPFDDGNGRMARAIADMMLARSDNTSQRLYSMSAQIQKERGTYYDILEQTQKGSLDITLWMIWFLDCLGRAIDDAQTILGSVLVKASVWEKLRGVSLNERQTFILNRLLDGFDGKINTSKYAKLAKCSQDTALRDIALLVEQGIFMRSAGGGRSTSYALAGCF